jgi:hypothetical protein
MLTSQVAPRPAKSPIGILHLRVAREQLGSTIKTGGLL